MCVQGAFVFVCVCVCWGCGVRLSVSMLTWIVEVFQCQWTEIACVCPVKSVASGGERIASSSVIGM